MPRPKKKQTKAAAPAPKAQQSRRFHSAEEKALHDEERGKKPFIVILLFWPFLVVNALTLAWPSFLRIPTRILGHGFVLGVLAFLVAAIFYGVRAQRFEMREVAEMPERSIVLDRNGIELGKLHGENRKVIPLSAVSHHFRQALLAREDVRFEDHGAIDFKGIARAVVQNVKRRRFAQGASTLTMQLARNSFQLSEEGSGICVELDRKFLEIAVAVRIERHFSKDEIFEHYVNRIFWGHSIQGIEAASQSYLEKSAKELTLSDAAMLAGIIRGPNAFSPFRNPDKAIRERDVVLKGMVQYNFISQDQADRAIKEVPKIRARERRQNSRTYAMAAIGQELDEILEDSNLSGGGLEIRTTIDDRLQKTAEKALDSHLTKIEGRGGYTHRTRKAWKANAANQGQAPDYLQGGLVLIENKTGAILSTVGGRDANESSFDRATQAKRPVGSIFKPFVFMTAHDRHRSKRLSPRSEDDPVVLPKTWVSDERMRSGEIAGAPKDWIPRNSDGEYFSLIHVQDALIQSRNTSSIRVGSLAGLDNVIETARLAGFEDQKIPRVPSCYLGTWNASPLQVASAYTIFPNLGTRYPTYLISEIIDRHGTVVYRNPRFSSQAASPGAAWATSHVLQQVVTRGTGSALPRTYGFRYPAGGKTGTTNNYKDGWYAGYTSELTCAVWVGMDRPQKVMDKGYGSTLALPIWVEVMKEAARLGTHPFGDLAPDLPFTKCRLCQFSAQRATSGCEQEGCAYDAVIPNDLVPAKANLCTMHRSQGHSRSPRPTNTTPPPQSQPQPQRVIPQALPVRQPPQQAPPRRTEPPQALPYFPEPAPRNEPPQALPVQ